jgi:HPt (histidine-containing phosphotransfer) domain-containing protein
MQTGKDMPTTTTTVRISPDMQIPPDATEMLRAIWQRQQVRVGERVELVERAAQALGQGQLDASLLTEATRAAHMLAGSLGTFGFAEASRAAHALELELERVTLELKDPQPLRVTAMAELLAELHGDLEAETQSRGQQDDLPHRNDRSEHQRTDDEQRGDQQDHEHLPDEQPAFVAPVA